MKAFKSLIILSIQLSFISVSAQVEIYHGQLARPIPENFFSASPDVMAFQKQDLFPVSLYTGKIDLQIPIYEIRSGNITVPIALSYNSGGIKVDDFSSSVGSGWSISAGGSIIRNIKDLPDNEVSYSLFMESDWDLGTILKPQLAAYGYNRKGAVSVATYMSWGAENRFAVYDESYTNDNAGFQNDGGRAPVKDLSPDFFRAAAPGLAADFTCINSSTNLEILQAPFTATFLDNSGARMESVITDKRAFTGYGFYEMPVTGSTSHLGRATRKIKDFFEFNITSTEGLTYRFNEEEVSESFFTPLGDIIQGSVYGMQNMAKTMESNNYSKRIHTWNLRQITDSKTNKTVVFDYETYGNPYLIENTFINVNVDVASFNAGDPQNTRCKFNLSSDFGSNLYQYNGAMESWEKHPRRKRLKKISFEEGSVEFVYGMERQDYPGERALTEIVVKDFRGAQVCRHVLDYGYALSKELCSQPECKRLVLNGIDQVSQNDGTLKHTFEYDTTKRLPRRGSLEQDYLGYYNGNGITGTSSPSHIFFPKLYFYQNLGINALLPFQLSNATASNIIPGEISLVPNSNSLAGLLKKITYPTGGYSEFEYENNRFRFSGAEYIGGGARIKKQKLADAGSTAREMTYQYVEGDGLTSGYINNIPVYGYISSFKINSFAAKNFEVFDKPKSGIELSSGSFIGYSSVTESENGNGRTVHEFLSPRDYRNVPESRVALDDIFQTEPANTYDCTCRFLENSAYPSMVFVDKSTQQGKLASRAIYNSLNTLLNKEEYVYTYRSFPNELALSKEIEIRASAEPEPGYAGEFNHHLIRVSSTVPVSQFLNSKITKTAFYNSGNITQVTDFEYHPSYPLVRQESFSEPGNTLAIRKFYPGDNPPGSTYSASLVQKNRLSETIRTETRRENSLSFTEQMNYMDYGNGLVLPKSLSASKGGLVLEEGAVVDIRDEKGNILQYHNEANTYFTVLWGYNKAFPIAKLENLAYSIIPASTISSLQSKSNTDTEANLILALNSLRTSFPNTMITTYTYKPLVGISTATDAKGQITSYEYDSFNRLKFIRDSENNILSENEYHYKP